MKMAGTTLFLLIALILIQDIYCTNSETSKADQEDVEQYVDDPDFFDYQALIVSETYYGTHKCGGSIISNKYILTAASCVDGARTIKVRTGIHNISEPEEDNPYIEGYPIIHPSYDPTKGVEFNIALIELYDNITLGVNKFAIHLAEMGTILSSGYNVTVTGWGITTVDETENNAELNQIHLTVIPQNECGNDTVRITDNSFCTGSIKNDENVCQSFAGDPAVIYEFYNYQQVGVVASTSKDGCSNGHSVFANIGSYFIRAWIIRIAGV